MHGRKNREMNGRFRKQGSRFGGTQRNRHAMRLQRLTGWLLLLLLALATPAHGQVYADQPPQGFSPHLHWTVFDVDEGDAMLLECGGESLLVDGGPWPFRDMLRRRLAEAGYLHLDHVLNTHYHDDHIDGLYDLFCSGFTAGEYLHGYSETAIQRNERGKRTVEAAKAAGVLVRRVGHGEGMTLGEAQVRVYQCTAVENTNARSLVVHITYGDATLLLCADITGAAQHWFVDHLPEKMLAADVVKLPHHGINPTVTEFLDAVDPSALVVTNRPDRIEPASQGQLDYRQLPVWFSGLGTVHGVTDGVDWYIWQE